MTTYRERKLSAGWSGVRGMGRSKRVEKQSQSFNAAKGLADSIPFGQPILVGHHSEKGARRDQECIHSSMSKGVEDGKMADRHTRGR